MKLMVKCSSIGMEWTDKSQLMTTLAATRNGGEGTARSCYSSDSYFYVGPHTNVWAAKDWDDQGGKIICACEYVRGDGSDGDTTCYSRNGGWGMGWNLHCHYKPGLFFIFNNRWDDCKCESQYAQKPNKCMVCQKTRS